MHTPRTLARRLASASAALATLPLAAAVAAAQAPKVFTACFVAATGTVYRIDKPAGSAPGAPTACGASRKGPDVEFTWTDDADAVRVSTTAGGDLAGTFGSPQVARLLGRALAATPPAAGQVLQWNGTAWAPATPASGVSAHGQLSGLAADDHAQYLLAGGARAAANGFAVTGTFGAGAIAAAGTGTRLVWYPRKAAFRAGYASEGRWDDAGIGNYSTATGVETMATGHGSVALGVFALSSGNGSVAMGNSVQASADQATAFGNGTVASGVGSVAMGVGGQATAGSAFAAGWYTTASGHNSTALGNWASTNGQTGAFVLGDFSVASNVSASARDQFTARFQNGYRLFTNSALTAGVALAPGGGAWQTVSDARKKTAFRAVDGEEVLAKLAALPVTTWQYKAQDPSVRHMGPTAQEFRAAFGLGESDTTITTTDADGVALAAARALEARTRALAARLDALARENAALRRQVAALGGTGARGRGAARQVGTR